MTLKSQKYSLTSRRNEDGEIEHATKGKVNTNAGSKPCMEKFGVAYPVTYLSMVNYNESQMGNNPKIKKMTISIEEKLK